MIAHFSCIGHLIVTKWAICAQVARIDLDYVLTFGTVGE